MQVLKERPQGSIWRLTLTTSLCVLALPLENPSKMLFSSTFVMTFPSATEASASQSVNVSGAFSEFRQFEPAENSEPSDEAYVNVLSLHIEKQGNISTADGKLMHLVTDIDQNLGRRCGPSPLVPAQIEDLVVAAAQRYGVDPKLATAIAWTESRFDLVRNSPKGARGPMQLMPDIARRFGVGDACDPVSNIDGGMRYLRVLLDEFHDPLVAAAAYNAGEQAVHDHGGVPPYVETLRYIASIINRQLSMPLGGSSRLEPEKADLLRAPRVERSGNGVIGARAVPFVNDVMQF